MGNTVSSLNEMPFFVKVYCNSTLLACYRPFNYNIDFNRLLKLYIGKTSKGGTISFTCIHFNEMISNRVGRGTG